MEILDRTLLDLTGKAPAELAVGDETPPSVRDVTLQVAADRAVFSISDVMDAAHAVGNEAKYESVSSILSRLSKEGVLDRGAKRGTYKMHDDTSMTSVPVPDLAPPSDPEAPPDPNARPDGGQLGEG